MFTYINTVEDADDRIDIEKGKLVISAEDEGQTINVAYKNDSKKLVTFAADELKLYVEDDKTKAEVMAAGDNEDPVDVNPGATKNLFENDLALEVGSEAGKLNPGKSYTVKLLLDGELQDEVLKVYVKSDDSSAKKVTVKGVEADLEENTVKLPVGTNLENLKASDVVVTKNHAEATVKDVKVEEDEGDTKVTFKIVAEDGTDTDYAITVSVVVAPVIGEDKVNFTIDGDDGLALAFTNTDEIEVTSVKLGTTTLKRSEYTVDSNNVTITAAAVNYYIDENELEADDTIKAVVTFKVGGSLEYTVTLEAPAVEPEP